tara:strand:- start:20 stop:655 length:636 start_codon:yes stop_codon:yes gene_type:complete
MSKLYNTKFKPTKAGIVQAAVDYVIKKIPRKKKVSPDIKSVGPTKLPVSKSIEKTKSDEFIKRYKAVDKAEDKMKTGKKMMREGQKERKKLIDTGRAVQFKYTKGVHAIKPGEKDRFKGLTTEKKPKKFKTGKELARENRMGGGMMGRRMGYSRGNPKPKTNVEKIKETFGNKKNLKKIPEGKKGEGLRKLKAARPDVTRKMGFLKRGGRA